ncbi:MAG: hypothetical protein NUV32_10365 [Exilispira sp.]|nr:hypothetical protein [Exilispira sp.]
MIFKFCIGIHVKKQLFNFQNANIIFLFIAIPALASTPTNENAPTIASEDQKFLGLTTLSEEQLTNIKGDAETVTDQTLIYIPQTKTYINTKTGQTFTVININYYLKDSIIVDLSYGIISGGPSIWFGLAKFLME